MTQSLSVLTGLSAGATESFVVSSCLLSYLAIPHRDSVGGAIRVGEDQVRNIILAFVKGATYIVFFFKVAGQV